MLDAIMDAKTTFWNDHRLNELFPFHLVLDKNLKIKKVGPSIKKILDLNIDHLFFEYFEISRPNNVTSFSDILKHKESLFLFNSLQKSQFKFRGQMYFDQQENYLFFLGSPLLRSFNELNDSNITLNDFAVHDNTSHFLFALQMQEIALNDTKVLSKKIKDHNDYLESTNEYLDLMVYRMTHDLRAPALNVGNMLGMLKQSLMLEEDSDEQKIFKYAESSTNKLLDTITSFIELAKFKKSKNASPITCNLTENFEHVENLLNHDILNHNVIINKDFRKANNIYCVKEDLISILQNLLSNSIKYKSNDRILVVDITSSIKENDVHIKYTDNGVGIDLATHKNKLFSIFSRFHSDTKIEGTGIGLYLVKQLIDRYNGTITVESQINKGTSFFITLPKGNK